MCPNRNDNNHSVPLARVRAAVLRRLPRKNPKLRQTLRHPLTRSTGWPDPMDQEHHTSFERLSQRLALLQELLVALEQAMGADGLQGMQAISRKGGMTIGQDEASCAVYGMPRSCAEAGVLQHAVSLLQIPEQILQAIQYRRRA